VLTMKPHASQKMTIRNLLMHLRGSYRLLLWIALVFAVSAQGALAQTPSGPTPVQSGPTPTQAGAPASLAPMTPAPGMVQTGAVMPATPAPSPIGLCQCISDFNGLDFSCPGSAAACQSSCGTKYSYVPSARCGPAGQ
jgi:hypothetical protein